MGLRLPNTLDDAKDILKEVLDNSKGIALGYHNSDYVQMGVLSDYTLTNIESAELDMDGINIKNSNMHLMLKYKEGKLTKNSKFVHVNVIRHLHVLSAAGVKEWGVSLTHALWGGDFPSTVAVDIDRGDVFFFNIRLQVLELIRCGTMSQDHLTLFLEDIDYVEPYNITIDPDALFQYVAGGEGYNHLKRNILIEFNCSVKFNFLCESGVVV